MRTKMSVLDELKRAYPEGVVQRMNQYSFKTNEHIDTIQKCSDLSAEQKQEICDHIENMNAFFKYVELLIEPIAYTTIDNVKLIRKDYFERFKEILSHSVSLTENEIHSIQRILQHTAEIKHQKEKLLDELNEMNNKFKHPYQ